MIYNRIKELVKKNDTSINALEAKIGISRGSLCKIDNHKPSSEKIQKLAEELNTTVDYLLTGKEPEFTVEMADTDVALSNMNKRMKEYALKLANLPKEKQEHIMSLIDMLEK